MWEDLPKQEKKEYKKMILVFASLTELFAQKASEKHDTLIPILNSKYQETVFRKTFNASIEDIGNTSFDASINGDKRKYLIGLKTFGLKSGDQKISQFKAFHNEWSSLIENLRKNAIDTNGHPKSKQNIDTINKPIYLELAKKISVIRNNRIKSSKANIQGFKYNEDVLIESVYHVLMPAVDNTSYPYIAVGEASYDEINIDNIEILGCTDTNHPTNFIFSDGKHTYKFTSADSQLYMNFDNKNIIKDTWQVKYAKDAYKLFSDLASKIYKEDTEEIEESYCWTITNKHGQVELFSGFNQFYAVGSKKGKNIRQKSIDLLKETYKKDVETSTLENITDDLYNFFFKDSKSDIERNEKVILRKNIIEKAVQVGNEDFLKDINKMVYRPEKEVYIPIPHSKKFHLQHPSFFTNNKIEFNKNGNLITNLENRSFNLIFEPSGNTITAFIAQDWGKGIESRMSMSVLGEWVLREIFLLKVHEPLTSRRLEEVEKNAVRLYKKKGSVDIHLQFTWVDINNPPDDLWQ